MPEGACPARDPKIRSREHRRAMRARAARVRESRGSVLRLRRACPASLREGRRLKTKFRLGCHDLRSSSCRMQLVRNAQCPCCESRESETIQHTLFECEAFEEEREAFLARLYSVCPPARQLSDEGRCRWVMGDELPREIENSLYRYLIVISKLRLGILTEQGEGS